MSRNYNSISGNSCAVASPFIYINEYKCRFDGDDFEEEEGAPEPQWGEDEDDDQEVDVDLETPGAGGMSQIDVQNIVFRL